jgi:hypothetical protein
VIYLPLGIAAAVIMWFTLRLPRPADRLPVDYAGALSLAVTVDRRGLLARPGI